MFERDLQLHRLSFTLNLKRQDVARVGMRADQIRKINLPVKWIHIVAVLVDLVIADSQHNIADLHAGFHRGQVWLDVGDINAPGFTGLSGVFAQLWIARWKK